MVILCGGQGTRMGSADKHKVCFDIGGVPAINRTVGMFRDLGVGKIVVVVGALAGQVMRTVQSAFPDVIFARQRPQQGTGHAALVGVRRLRRVGHAGPVLLTMGDKVIEPSVIEDLAARFVRSGCDMVFVTGPKAGTSNGAGRVVSGRGGVPLRVVERRDIQRLKIMARLDSLVRQSGRRSRIPAESILKAGRRHITDRAKLVTALGSVGRLVYAGANVPAAKLRRLLGANPGTMEICGTRLTAAQVERRSRTVNLSVYLARSELLYRLLPKIKADNAQGEYYLTDLVQLAAEDRRSWKLEQQTVRRWTDVMAFNSPDELLRIRDVLRRSKAGAPAAAKAPAAKLDPRQYRPASEWLEIFDRWPPALRRTFARIYGPDDALLRGRRAVFLSAIRLFIKRFGPNRRAVVLRAPGRLNLMGRHVDHRGGAVNVIAIDRDDVFVAAPRDDDRVRLASNDRARFPDREFAISELLGSMPWDDWLGYVNSAKVRDILRGSRGDWSNYVKAAFLRLQHRCERQRLVGMDAAVAGDVPMAAGLSSSSAMVVASAEAAVAFNNLNLTPSEFVDFCGEGEWFVGSRGGAADHAAIRLGRRGSVAHIVFFQFGVEGTCPMPPGCRVLIANSGQSAHKSASAKDSFNERVACYELGFMLLKDRLPQYAHLLEHLRDVNARRLGCSAADIYRMLLEVPEAISRRRLVGMLSARHRERVDRIFSSHRPPETYALRGVLMFGIAECERSRLAPEVLRGGDLAAFGRMMNVSHDGDRVCRYRRGRSGRWRRSAYAYDVSDAAIAARCDDLTSGDDERTRAAGLDMQPGAYRCSTDRIDRMVDIARSVPGVYGAQLAGAGLGGCIMVLARPGAMGKLKRLLREQYYEPAGVEPDMHVCRPVEGSGLISV